MGINILGISTSPRRNGNSDLLLKKTLEGAESAGGTVEYLNLNDYKINPCIECNSCYKTGRCIARDDYHQVLEKLLKTDRLIFATPVFFMSVCAQAKTLIDRGQCLWVEKHILKKEKPLRDRRAMIIAVGGSRSIKQYECIRWTFKTYVDCLRMTYSWGLFVGKIDEFGAIEKHPAAFSEAFRMGALLVSPITGTPEKPIETEIIETQP